MRTTRLPFLPVLLIVLLSASAAVPVSALLLHHEEPAAVSDFSKNGLYGRTISFSPDDFTVTGSAGEELRAITLESLPAPGSGTLTVAGLPTDPGTVIEASALSGLQFAISPAPAAVMTGFTFRPIFTSGNQGDSTSVTLYLLKEENVPPIARDMELFTYRNVSLTGYFDALDRDGDVLTFRLLSTPARGSVSLDEDSSCRFLYSPYENKSGRDTFTYVAEDTAGNTSSPATVTIRIAKPDTSVTYADLKGHEVEKAAVRLAEEGLYVGSCLNGHHFFQPDRPITRAEFLSLAAGAAGLEPLEGVSMTGFTDDAAIPIWAKGVVSAAVRTGAVQGAKDDSGAVVFRPGEPISLGEASVMLNRLLSLADVPCEVFLPYSESRHWADQSAANLAACGVLHPERSPALSAVLTLGDAALLLDGVLDADTPKR